MILLGFDLSTQSCKGLLYDDEKHTIIGEEQIIFAADLAHYKTDSGFHRGPDGAVESPVLMWVEALEMCIARLAENFDLSTVDTIGGAAQQHGTVYWIGIIL